MPQKTSSIYKYMIRAGFKLRFGKVGIQSVLGPVKQTVQFCPQDAWNTHPAKSLDQSTHHIASNLHVLHSWKHVRNHTLDSTIINVQISWQNNLLLLCFCSPLKLMWLTVWTASSFKSNNNYYYYKYYRK